MSIWSLSHPLDPSNRLVLAILDRQVTDDGVYSRWAGFGDGNVEKGVWVERRREEVERSDHVGGVGQLKQLSRRICAGRRGFSEV
jgi:hypothetical protein